jgi:hypothetical protein
MSRTMKKKADDRAPDGNGKPFCRLVLIPLDTREFRYQEWEPTSEEQRLLAVAAKYMDQRPQKFDACVQYKDPLPYEPDARINAAPVPAIIVSPREQDDSFVREMCERLSTLGPTEDSEIKICVIGIRQRLDWMRDPRLDYQEYGRRLLECARFWDEIERHIKRKPKVKAGRDRAEKLKVAAAEWQTQIETEVRRLLEAGMTDFGIAGRLYNETGRASGTVEKFVAKVRSNMLKK